MAERITKARLACLPQFYRRLVLDGGSQITVENLNTDCPPRAVLWNLQGSADASLAPFRDRSGPQLTVVTSREYWGDDFFEFLDGGVQGALFPESAIFGSRRNRRIRLANGLVAPRRLDLRLADELFEFAPYRPYFDLWLGLADSWPAKLGARRV